MHSKIIRPIGFCLFVIILINISFTPYSSASAERLNLRAENIVLEGDELACVDYFLEGSVAETESLLSKAKRVALSALQRIGFIEDRAKKLQNRIDTYVKQMQNFNIKINRSKLEAIAEDILLLLNDSGIIAKLVWVPFYSDQELIKRENKNPHPRIVPAFEIIKVEERSYFDKQMLQLFNKIGQSKNFWKDSNSQMLKIYFSPFELASEISNSFVFDLKKNRMLMPLFILKNGATRESRENDAISIRHEIIHAANYFQYFSYLKKLQNKLSNRAHSISKQVKSVRIENLINLASDLSITLILNQNVDLSNESLSNDVLSQDVIYSNIVGIPFSSLGQMYATFVGKNEEVAYFESNFKINLERKYELTASKSKRQFLTSYRFLSELFIFHELLYSHILEKLNSTLSSSELFELLDLKIIPSKFRVGNQRSAIMRIRIPVFSQSSILNAKKTEGEVSIQTFLSFEQTLEHRVYLPFWSVLPSKELLHYVEKGPNGSGEWIREDEQSERGLQLSDLKTQIENGLKRTRQKAEYVDRMMNQYGLSSWGFDMAAEAARLDEVRKAMTKFIKNLSKE